MVRSIKPTQFRLLEEMAEQFLLIVENKHGISCIPSVPIEKIAKDCLGLRCEIRDLIHPSGGTEGSLLVNDGVIFVSRNSNAGRKRFTIAHEIGHRVLPSPENPGSSTLYGFGGKNDSDAKAKSREDALNIFAGAILMPRSRIRAEARTRKCIDSAAIYYMANHFRVSVSAMLVRVNYLLRNYEPLESAVDFDSLEQLEAMLFQEKDDRSTETDMLARMRQLSFNDSWPFTPGQYGAEHSPAVWFLIEVLSKLGISTAGRDELHDITQSPLEVLGRPLVLEFAGTPNSGKDTQIEIVADYLRDVRKLNVKIVNEGYRSSPMTGGSSTDKFDWSWLTVLRHIVEIKYDLSNDVVIFNRGLFDSLGFNRFHNRMSHITKSEKEAINTALLAKRFRNCVDAVFLLEVPWHVSVTREKQQSRKILYALSQELSEPVHLRQNLINEKSLSLLNECYEDVFQESGHLFRFVQRLNTSYLSKKQASFELIGGMRREFIQNGNRRNGRTPKPHFRNGRSGQPSKEMQLSLPGM